MTLVLGCVCHWVSSLLVPRRRRDPSLWVFGARGGFGDNAKYLYLYVLAHHPEIRPVWLSNRTAAVDELRKQGYEAYHPYSFRGVWFSLRAGIVVVTHGLRDVNLSCSGGALSVLLWHGTPLKKISWDAGFREEGRVVKAAHRYTHRVLDLVTVATDAVRESFVSGLGVDPDVVHATGYPRNDVFSHYEGDREGPGCEIGVDRDALRELRVLAGSKPVVLYLPTFRNEEDGGERALERLDAARLERFLERIDAYCYVKAHPNESTSGLGTGTRVKRIADESDVYPLLPRVDLLVTDYSSILFDFLLLDRPLVFYPYDLDRYRAERGFYYEYEAVIPGPIATEFDDLLDEIERSLATDPFAAERRTLCERFCRAGTNRSENVCNAVIERLDR